MYRMLSKGDYGISRRNQGTLYHCRWSWQSEVLEDTARYHRSIASGSQEASSKTIEGWELCERKAGKPLACQS